MNTISFKDIKKLFSSKDWDVGYISAEGLLQCANSPIKATFHPSGANFTNNLYFNGITNCIILVRSGDTGDYSFYDEASEILKQHRVERCFHVYTNFKEAAILAGVGVRARNSLIYTYKFGFDAHICAIGFQDTIIDLPTNKRVNHKLWRRCKGCDDCARACPVGAIHNDREPYWLDSGACDTFIAVGDHPTVPSIKKFWHKNVYPEIPIHEIKEIKSFADTKKRFSGPLPFDKNGWSYDGFVTRKDGNIVQIPVCRECTSQPRCSKWGGKFPYEQ
jgi:ferredoxin